MTSIKILFGTVMCLNLFWGYFNFYTAEKIGNVDVHVHPHHNPDYTIYGGDIYYIDGNKLYTESGEIDTVFNNNKELSLFLEQASADSYKEALAWEIDRIIRDYASVLVMSTGEVFINYCNPYDEDDCFEINLNTKDCDEYDSCLFYNE